MSKVRLGLVPEKYDTKAASLECSRPENWSAKPNYFSVKMKLQFQHQALRS